MCSEFIDCPAPIRDAGIVMAAGDRVLLGNPGSKIIVEMDSVTLSGSDNPEGFGSVTNEGQITANGGKVVLAAGDIFSVPLHPQLQVNSGTVEEPVYNVDDQRVTEKLMGWYENGRPEVRGKAEYQLHAVVEKWHDLLSRR